MAFVSVTRLRLRHWRFLPVFFWHTIPSFRQARQAKGNLSADVLNDRQWAFWTRSVWVDESAMRAYMTSGAHMKAMPYLMEWCDEAATTHWVQAETTPPASSTVSFGSSSKRTGRAGLSWWRSISVICAGPSIVFRFQVKST